MSNRPKIVAILFGRGGSVGLPKKNVKPVLGRPSLHYPLMAARASGIVEEIYISSDSEEIFELARAFEITEIRRPPELANNHALLEDAIFHAFQTVEAAAQKPVDLYLILLCNAITVMPQAILQAAEMLLSDPGADSVTTGSKLNMFSPVRARRLDRGSGHLMNFIPLDTLSGVVDVSCDRDKSEDCYFCDNSFTLVRRGSLATLYENAGPFRWMGNRIRLLEQLPGAGDIDFAWQVPVIEWWLVQHGFTADKVPYAFPGALSGQASRQ